MRIDPRAWLVWTVVIALLWLAVEGEVGLAGVVVDARHVTAPLLDESGERAGAWIVKGGPS